MKEKTCYNCGHTACREWNKPVDEILNCCTQWIKRNIKTNEHCQSCKTPCPLKDTDKNFIQAVGCMFKREESV
jgi:hypothetical protein